MTNILKKSEYISIAFLAFVFFYFTKKTIELWDIPYQFAFEDWICLQQTTYITSLFMALFFVCNIERMRYIVSLSIFGAFACEKYDFFDRYVHHFFIDNGVYKLLGQPLWSGNPQYSKLLFFVLFGVIILFKTFFQKKYTMNLILVSLFLGVNLVLVFLNHQVFPGGILKNLTSQRREILVQAERMNGVEFSYFCKYNNLHCRKYDGQKIESVSSSLEKLDENELKYFSEKGRLLQSQRIIEIINTSNLPSIFIILKNNENIYYEIFDHKTIKNFWQMSVNYFSKNVFIVSFLWLYFVLFLSFIHRRVKRVKII